MAQQSTNLTLDNPEKFTEAKIESIEEQSIADPTKLFQSPTNSPFSNRLDNGVSTIQSVKMIKKITGIKSMTAQFEGSTYGDGCAITINRKSIDELPANVFPIVSGAIKYNLPGMVNDFGGEFMIPSTVFAGGAGVLDYPSMQYSVSVHRADDDNITIKFFAPDNGGAGTVNYTIYILVPVNY